MLQRSGGRPEVFAKVGDSITISGAFFRCFDGDDVRWGEHENLKESRDFFARTRVDDRATSFGRATEAARVGWRTMRILKGIPTPLDKELLAIRPAWAVVMLGTNDTYTDSMQGYAIALRALIDALLKRNVVPLLSTIPPRRDKQEAREQVVEMNAVVRMMAQSRQVPLMDLFSAMDGLDHGGLGRDGIHPDAFRDNLVHPCWLDTQGLSAGMNQRNLLVLEALDRLRRKVLEGEPPDPPSDPEPGDGSWEKPSALLLPDVAHGDLRGGLSRVTSYGCNKEQFAGPERVYRVEIAQPKRLRIRLFPEGKGRLGLRWLTSLEPPTCGAHARSRLDLTAKAGTFWLVVESGSEKDAGPYGLTVLER